MAEVDSRFDPVFQRGYDPAKHGGRSRPRAEEPAAPEAPIDTTRSETPPVDAIDATETLAAAATVDDPPRRGIPYRLVLLLASIAAILGSAALVWQRITADPLDAYYGTNPGILFRMQLVDALITPLLVAGLTGITLWLALGALRRRDDA